MATFSYNFKKITVVQPAKDFIDATLSKTQRKTPTVIHKHLEISRIRGFYLRKVKFTQQNFHDRLEMILTEFPRLEDIHPFYADLMNVLYDRDHYKLALGQISTAKHLIDSVARDYGRLLKFGDSLYRCKLLKTAALGRMCTIIKRQKSALEYLEEVRQHLSRLPSIDPTARTLLLAGFPNVGKSSLINLLTRADVEVQPYAFTTKSLYVGHMDYNYLRWQVIDTPGILDHELEERNAIEWQSVTALAHLKAAIIYIVDISEECGTPIQTQIDLFKKIKPLFQNKPVFVMLNKIDIKPFDQLSPENQELLTEFLNTEGVKFYKTSNVSKEGIMDMRNEACDQLLTQRVEAKLRAGRKTENILNRIYVAQPQKRDERQRPTCIPSNAPELREDAEKRPKVATERDLEIALDDEYILDLRKTWDLKNPEEAADVIPEIWEGKNIADFVDPDIMEKLEKLEQEEAEREASGFYKLDYLEFDSDDQEIHDMAKVIRRKRKINKMEARVEPKAIGRAKLPRKGKEALENKMEELGIGQHLRDGAGHYKQAIDRGRSVIRKRQKMNNNEAMDVDHDEEGATTRSKSRNRSLSHVKGPSRDKSGVRQTDVAKSEKLRRGHQKVLNKGAKKGEADRRFMDKKPKHLFSGKRTQGTHDRR